MSRQILDMSNDKLEELFSKTNDNFEEVYQDNSEQESILATKAKQVDLDTLKARVDNLVANPGEPTEGNTELVDIRVGEDGTQYPTAGEAVRGQVSKLKGDLVNNVLKKSIRSENMNASYDGTRLKFVPLSDERWSAVFVDDCSLLFERVATGTPLTVISETDEYYLGFNPNGTGNLFRLNKSDGGYRATTSVVQSLSQAVNYNYLYCKIVNNETVSVYGYNDCSFYLLAELNVTEYFNGIFTNISLGFSRSNTNNFYDILCLSSNDDVLNMLYTSNSISNNINMLIEYKELSSEKFDFLFPFTGKKIFIQGDSISDNRPVGGLQGFYIPNMLKYLGIADENCYNFAISGQPITQTTTTQNWWSNRNKFTDLKNTGIMPDLIFLWGGTNDFGLSLPVGDDVNSTNHNELRGALNKLLEMLVTEFPNTQIIMATPMQRNTGHEAPKEPVEGLGPNEQGLYLIDYVNAIKDACEKYSIPCLDMYNVSGLNMVNARELTRNGDGLHPTKEYGEKKLSKIIAKFINNYASNI